MARYDHSISKEIEDEIIKLRKRGYSLREIEKDTTVNDRTCHAVLVRRGHLDLVDMNDSERLKRRLRDLIQ